MRMSVSKTKQSPKMSKATSIKEALKRWEEKHPDQELSKAKEVSLHFQFPPIEKMDNALSLVHNCEKLSLSTNMIEKIAGLNSFKHLKVLCLSRNYIKNLSGLEGVAETLEQLWVSYNFIEKVKGIQILKNLQVLYISNNLIKDWSEFNKLQDLPALEDLLFLGNPLQENYDETTWKSEATRRLPNLKKLDGETVVREGSEISV